MKQYPPELLRKGHNNLTSRHCIMMLSQDSLHFSYLRIKIILGHKSKVKSDKSADK